MECIEREKHKHTEETALGDKEKQASSREKIYLEKVLAQTQKARQHSIDEKILSKPQRYAYNLIGKILDYQANNQATVSFSIDGHQYQYQACSTINLGNISHQQDCVLSFNQGYLDQPIIMGVIQTESYDKTEEQELAPLVLKSEQGISLQCGASRIELDENGTINIQGMHINSQAYGPHRIKGGSVKIN